MVEEEGQKEEKFDFDSAGEAVGYISLEQARVLAIEHARDNTDFYGPRYRNRRLVWEAVSADEGEDFYEVRLSYRPAGRFRGTPGVEQFTIDKTGGVRIRQILDEPVSKGLPRWPLALVGLAVVAAAVLAYLVFLAPERDEEPVALADTPAPLPAGAPAAIPTPQSISGSPRAAAFFEDFEGGPRFAVNLPRGAEVICDPGNCFLRHIATPDTDIVHSGFGDPSWEDYGLVFRFNVRTDSGGPAVVWRATESDDRYFLDGDASSGFVLVAVKDEEEFFVEEIRAPFSVREWHTLLIKAEGSLTGILLDDVLIAEIEVPDGRASRSGSADVHTHPVDGEPVEVWYDDVLVIPLDEAPVQAAAPLGPTPTPESVAAVTPPTPASAPIVVPAPTTAGGGMTRGATISGTVRDADTGLPSPT